MSHFGLGGEGFHLLISFTQLSATVALYTRGQLTAVEATKHSELIHRFGRVGIDVDTVPFQLS